MTVEVIMNQHTAHSNFPPAGPAHPAYPAPVPADLWQHYPTHPALTPVAAATPGRAPTRRALTTAWVTATVALVLYPLSFFLGVAAVIAGLDGSDAAVPFLICAIAGVAAAVILTFVGAIAAIVASRSPVRRGGELVGVWVLVSLDLLGVLYLLTWFLPALV